MPVKNLVDPDANLLNVLDVDGYYLPPFGVKTQEQDFRMMVDHWQARDDDIILCNYPKSGTHWIAEILQMLYNQSPETTDDEKDKCMIELISKDHYDKLPSPRILNTHIHFSKLPRNLIKRKCKIIYLIRNPKDVAVSFYHHHRNLIPYGYEGTWDSYLPHRFLDGYIDYHSWFDYALDWNKIMEENKDYPFHVIQYEDMHLDSKWEIKRLANFLGKKCDDKLAQNIGENCNIDLMRTKKKGGSDAWRAGVRMMYRQGQVGRWKDTFTVAQNEMFDKIYKAKMVNFQLKLKFTI